ncbi:hypothetical protein TNCV_2330051 [Trichonephila clavipes]|nr:hypothetical protein TNCV_2330051 [Trichonephila clavipes]
MAWEIFKGKGQCGRRRTCWTPKVSDYRHEKVPTHISGQIINRHYYIEVLKRFREKIRKKCQNWVLMDDCGNKDNASAHMTLSVKQFLINKRLL